MAGSRELSVPSWLFRGSLHSLATQTLTAQARRQPRAEDRVQAPLVAAEVPEELPKAGPPGAIASITG